MAHGKFYTTEDDEWLREHYISATIEAIQQRFPNRQVRAIRQHAWELSLRRDKLSIQYSAPPATMIGHLPEVERAYLAGIIDGEGCIMLARRKPRGKANPVYAVCVSIANTSPALREWLEQRFPGKAKYAKRVWRSHPTWKDCWQWILSGNQQCMIFLREIAPYLVIKREQAELVANGYLALDEEGRYDLYLRLRALKRTA